MMGLNLLTNGTKGSLIGLALGGPIGATIGYVIGTVKDCKEFDDEMKRWDDNMEIIKEQVNTIGV